MNEMTFGQAIDFDEAGGINRSECSMVNNLKKVSGTSMNVTSLVLLIVGAVAPISFLVVVHVALEVRNRRRRNQSAIFVSEEARECSGAWEDSRARKEGGVWLTGDSNVSPGAIKAGASLGQRKEPSRWGTKFDLEETITAFFDASSPQAPISGEQSPGDAGNEETLSEGSRRHRVSHRSFERLCDVIINNMAPIDLKATERDELSAAPVDRLTGHHSGQFQVTERQSTKVAEGSEFSVEEEILRDFDAILSSYCDSENDFIEEWQHKDIKY